jgi:hypothetical protein
MISFETEITNLFERQTHVGINSNLFYIYSVFNWQTHKPMSIVRVVQVSGSIQVLLGLRMTPRDGIRKIDDSRQGPRPKVYGIDFGGAGDGLSTGSIAYIIRKRSSGINKRQSPVVME